MYIKNFDGWNFVKKYIHAVARIGRISDSRVASVKVLLKGFYSF